MNKTIASLLFLFFLLPCLAQEEATFRVELRLPKTDYILGEAIICTEVFLNAPLKPMGAMDWDAIKVQGPVKEDCRAERRKVEKGMQIGEPEKAPPEVQRTFLLSDCGIVNIGEYELWTEYPADLYLDRTYAPTPEAPTVYSNHVQVRIVAPKGLDSTIYESHHNNCNQITMDRDQLLKQYPSSTYGGWILYNTCPPLTGNRLGSLQDPEKALRAFCDRGGGEENTLRHLDLVQSKLRNYAEPVGQFLQAHPDSPYAQDLRKRYAMCLGLTGRMSEAMIQIEILAKGEGPKAEEAKAFLAEKDKEASPKEGSDKEK